MFDEKKYYSYIKDFKFTIGCIYSLYTIVSTILALILSNILKTPIVAIIIFILGIVLAGIHTKNIEIKIQEMYLNLMFYDEIKNKNLYTKKDKNKL